MNFKCYLCGNNGSEVIAERDDIRFGCYGSDKKVLRCIDCGLIQLFPQWTEKETDELYAKYWEKEDFKGQKRKIKISKYLTRIIRKEEVVLEIGCGHGDNIRFLRSKGFRVTGIDKDPSVCDGDTVINSDIRDYKLAKKPDLIYAIHLFEHLTDPGQFIAWMIDNLSDNGRFVLEVPSTDDPLLTLYKNENFKKFCWYPYHLFFYSKETAQRLFSGYDGLNTRVLVKQEYGLLNHLRWLFFGKPGNINFHLPVFDDIYKLVLTKVFGMGDTLVILGNKTGGI
jgi:SAM-dependent methyltransferase